MWLAGWIYVLETIVRVTALDLKKGATSTSETWGTLPPERNSHLLQDIGPGGCIKSTYISLDWVRRRLFSKAQIDKKLTSDSAFCILFFF